MNAIRLGSLFLTLPTRWLTGQQVIASPKPTPVWAAGIIERSPTCAALPVPTLRRPHDRDRDVRARLRAKLAPDAEHGRHVMTQAYCKRRDFPVPTRWLYAGTVISLDPITAINAPSAR